MSSVPKRHPVRLQPGGESQDLVSHADPKDGLVPLVDRLPDPHGRVHDGFRVPRSVGEEEPVVLIPDGVEIEIPGEDGDPCVSTDEGTDNVGLCSEIEQGDVDVSLGVERVDLFRRRLSDEVLEGRIPVLLIGRSGLSDILGTDGQSTERGALITEQRGDRPGVDARDPGDAVTGTPFVQSLDGGVVGVLGGHVRDDDTGALDARALEDRDPGFVGTRQVLGDTVVADHGRGEDEDLTEVRWVRHRFSV